jgi:hypothetical protein
MEQAFREVADPLIAYRKNREFRAAGALDWGSAGCHPPGRLPLVSWSYRLPRSVGWRYTILNAQFGSAQAQLNEPWQWCSSITPWEVAGNN